jgi:hypothetical protein
MRSISKEVEPESRPQNGHETVCCKRIAFGSDCEDGNGVVL